MTRRSLLLPAAVLLTMGLSLLLVRLDLLSPLAGFGLFLLAWGGGACVALASGALGLYRADGGATSAAAVHLLFGLLLISLLVVQGARGRGPAIHDITTDLDDPPQFVAARQLPENRGRDMSYPDGDPAASELQRAGYPDLAALVLAAEPERVHEAALLVAEQLGWTVTWSSVQRGQLEAFAVTPLFRFVDDVVVRIRPDAAGTRVDLRSTSRVGRSDLGTNARRIRAFLTRLQAELTRTRR